ncbi:MAG: OmpA family protein [Pseudobdellovibrionaceae bacterium]
MSKIQLLIITGIYSLFVGACAHRGVEKAEISPTTSPSEEITRMEGEIKAARDQDMHLLSPDYFAKAQKSLREAKEDYQDKQSNEEVLDDVAYAQAYLNKAKEAAGRSQRDLTSIMDARKAAVNARAETFYPNKLKKADKDLIDLTEEYESGKSASAKEMKRLQGDYIDLETDSLKAGYLGQARSLIDKAKESGARKYVPQTLEKAETAYQNAEKVIESDRNNRARVAEAVDQARGQAERVFELTSVAKSARNQTPEEIALAVEKRTHELDMKTAALEAQQIRERNVQGVLQATEKNLEKTEARLNTMKTHEEQQAVLAASKKLFTQDEAEVYQDGNNLLIRLKSIHFPSNRAEIPSKSMGTLAKVKEVMEKLSPGQVLVEGHTDSIGAADINKKLSEARAESIKDYLISHQAIPGDVVETRGVGYEKPISTNKTKEGRAQNRRVDIVISPSGSTVQ